MEKRVVFSAIVFVLITISFVSAINTDIRENYLPEENILLKINGNILEPITPGDVEFRRDHVAIPVNYDLKNLGGQYYLWAIAPRNENNYTLRIKDISTTEAGRVVKKDYIANFSVSGEIVEYRITPGFIYTKDNFDINIFLNRDQNVNLEVKFRQKENFVLNPGENAINFDIKSIEETKLIEISLGKYILPAYIIVENFTQKPTTLNLRFNPPRLESKVIEGKKPDYPFSVINYAGSDFEDIDFSYNNDLFRILPEGKFNLSSGNEKFFALSLNNGIRDKISEEIILVVGNNEIKMDIAIDLVVEETEEETPYLEGSSQESRNFYCFELTGSICTANEYCDGEQQPTIEGNCCLGLCVKKTNWFAIVIGILIVVGLGIGGYFIYKNYKGAGKTYDFLGKKIKKGPVREEENLNEVGLP